MKSLFPLILFAAAGCVASAKAPASSPDALAARLLSALDNHDPSAADALFAEVEEQEPFRQRIYPLLFQSARERYAAGDARRSASILRFLNRRYPDASAVREALLYALFVERSRGDLPTTALAEEIGGLLNVVRGGPGNPSAWVELIAAQHALDAGNMAEAARSYGRFRAQWDGNPGELALYIEDVERALRHNGALARAFN